MVANIYDATCFDRPLRGLSGLQVTVSGVRSMANVNQTIAGQYNIVDAAISGTVTLVAWLTANFPLWPSSKVLQIRVYANGGDITLTDGETTHALTIADGTEKTIPCVDITNLSVAITAGTMRVELFTE